MKYAMLAALLLLFQDPAPEGKAKSCDNAHDTPKAHRCECQRATKCREDRTPGEDSKCKTYCKPEACHCIDPCVS